MTPAAKSYRGRKFDRHVSFDERSRGYPIRAITPKTPRSYSWTVGVTLDQGQEGACVGFGWAHELAARPVVIPVTNEFAHDKIYLEAKKLDEWPGENYDGTSVIAGAKVVHNLGAMAEYRWAFNLMDLKLAVGFMGPAVLGVNWYSGMFEPDSNDFIHVSGELAGGHCICCYGVNMTGGYFRLHNSWGPDWGDGGNCKISFSDMDRLLHEQGEACIPVKRTKVAL